MTSVDDIAKELVGVLLTAQAKMLGEDPETVLDLERRVQGEIQAQRPHYPPLQNAKRTFALSVGVGGSRIAERGVLVAEAEIGKRRGVS